MIDRASRELWPFLQQAGYALTTNGAPPGSKVSGWFEPTNPSTNKQKYINNMISNHTSPARIRKRHDLMSRETSERRMKTRRTSNDESFHWAPVGMVLDLCPHCLSASTAETHMPGPNGQAKRPYMTANEQTDKTNQSSANQSFLFASVTLLTVCWSSWFSKALKDLALKKMETHELQTNLSCNVGSKCDNLP